MLAPYEKSGRLHPFDGAAQLFPGIRTVPAYGHTPGHTAYMIESQGQKLLAWGDIVHLGEVQFPHPDMTISYDSKRVFHGWRQGVSDTCWHNHVIS